MLKKIENFIYDFWCMLPDGITLKTVLFIVDLFTGRGGR